MAAGTFSVSSRTVMGDMRVVSGLLTITNGPTLETPTTLEYIAGGAVSIQTASGDGVGAIFNSTTNGYVRLQSGVSGGVYNVMVFGK